MVARDGCIVGFEVDVVEALDDAMGLDVRLVQMPFEELLPARGFSYQFAIVDQMEPNAFALPGGYVFVSRGLLLLANSEDELACVLGHEIIHVAHRHAAQQQALARSGSPLTMPWTRAAQMAAYSREMERNADEHGQLLCAAAGYDPAAMGTLLQTMLQCERLRAGASRTPGWFDTHPGHPERAAIRARRCCTASTASRSASGWRPVSSSATGSCIRSSTSRSASRTTGGITTARDSSAPCRHNGTPCCT